LIIFSFKFLLNAEDLLREIVTNLLPTKTGKTSGKTSGKILTYIKENNEITIPELAQLIGITERSVERNIQKLQEQNKLIRVGGAKGGFWKIPDK
jgi:ATP-dependent DNA helicase RecG